MAAGPAAALRIVDGLLGTAALARYHYLHAARAELLGQLGRTGEARAEYESALRLAGNAGERALLRRKLAALD
ncbi:putative RNA polymerase sigma factor containing a TPR repeat domain [Mycobacteroides abscessus subsp. abscessus]|nr:putative RNA polymerase sigma factor containing a TPR repeat domain [Mycobacteroides abscessus subsp. abscessus]